MTEQTTDQAGREAASGNEATDQRAEGAHALGKGFRPGRRSVLIIENDRLWDGDELSSVVIPTLREYADMLEKHTAGDEGFEIYEKPDGTKLTVISTIWGGQEIPHEPIPLYRRGA